MLYHNVRVAGSHLRRIDAVVVAAASALTWKIGFASWSYETGGQDPRAAVIFSVTAALAFIFLAVRIRAYHARRTEDVRSELVSLCELVFYALAVSCLITQSMRPGPPAYYAASWFFATISVVLSRLAMRILIRRSRRNGDDYRVWLIVGQNARTANLVRTIQANPHFGIRISEVVDLLAKDGRFAPRSSADDALGLSVRVAEDVESLRAIVGGQVIDEVVITLPIRTFYDEIQRILDFCCEAGIAVRLRPESFERASYRTELTHVGGMPMVTHFNGASNHVLLLMKRATDIIGASIGLIAGLPLYAAIAIAVKLTSPGPVFFRQTRVGLHGRQFRLVKFRSMVKDADKMRKELEPLNQVDSVAFKIQRDPRITRVGALLRRFHLDELPQLWNVLVGDMSLVGPRPLPPEEALGNEWWQRRRLSMPPGLTCLWQIQSDHTMPFQQWMQLDIRYIDKWSLWLDLNLIWSTFPVLVKGKGW
jgi:exopolysaccharide biosynthesis polyprenyl glycosylphosphotransferase